MKTVYEHFITKTENGNKFYINFDKKTLRCGHTFLVKDGKCVDGFDFMEEFDEDPYEKIEELYSNYRVSIPSERSEKGHTYFKALSADELSIEEMIAGEVREVAKAKLEGFILCAILSGKLKCKDNAKWFWKSEKFPELILLKRWFTKEEDNVLS